MTYNETVKYLHEKRVEWQSKIDAEPGDKFAIGMLTGLDIACIVVQAMHTTDGEPMCKEGRP